MTAHPFHYRLLFSLYLIYALSVCISFHSLVHHLDKVLYLRSRNHQPPFYTTPTATMAALLDRFLDFYDRFPESFDRFLGISKATFFDSHVVPANLNDAYCGNKCPFCWDKYGDTHEAVRVLSCNHVFGRDCLHDMLNYPNGHICPICRCNWNRPLWWSMMSNLLSYCRNRIINGYYHSLPPYVRTLAHLTRKLLLFAVECRNPYYWAQMIVSQWTNLNARNPELNNDLLCLRFAMQGVFVVKLCWFAYAYANSPFEAIWCAEISSNMTVLAVLFFTVLAVLFFYLLEPSVGCNSIQDARIITLILLVSSVIALLRQFLILLYISNVVLGLDGVLHPFLIGTLVL